MSNHSYTGITFGYDEFLKDIDRIRTLVGDLLRAESIQALRQFRERVESMRNAPGGGRLTIPIDSCLKTVESTEYRGAGQERPVYGALSFVWEIVHTDKGRRSQSSFDLLGEATTGISIHEQNDEPVARWQFEVGDPASPGCHFHASANQRGEHGLFPKWLKIPRLPGLLVSPFDGLDFLLGELFPEQWTQRVSEPSDVRNQWAKSQSHRMLKILQWQQKMVEKPTFGTPWISLKKAKPPLDILSR